MKVCVINSEGLLDPRLLEEVGDLGLSSERRDISRLYISKINEINFHRLTTQCQG